MSTSWHVTRSRRGGPGRLLCLVLVTAATVALCPGVALPQEGEVRAAREELGKVGHAFRAVYRQVCPAVVLITTTRQWQALQRPLPRFHPRLPEEEEPRGLGSGIIVSQDGYILSNHHVVEGADSILVTLDDHRVFPADVVGFDSLIDIALLKIHAVGLPVARLGNADGLQIGDWVLAIGHPLGMGTTLTHGIVSALGRQAQVIDDEYGIESFIQTNAVINPGNSGGPLLNLDGEVVGINTAISTRTGYFMGYGLAVPVNLAQEAMRDILTHGRVVRGYLGVAMVPVDHDMLGELRLGLDHPAGVWVEVLPGSPAQHAGLRTGDVIVAVRGRQVDRANEVQALIYGLDPGDRVALSLLRDGRRQEVEVVLGEREEDRLLVQGEQRMLQLGLTVVELSRERAAELGFGAEVAEELGFAQGEQAVVVTAVDPGSQAAERRIEIDDVITDIDQTRITSLSQFMHLVTQLGAGESALFWLWRPRQGVDVRVLEIPK